MTAVVLLYGTALCLLFALGAYFDRDGRDTDDDVHS